MPIANPLNLLAALLVFGAIALMDLRQRRIANELVLAVIALALIQMAASRDVTSSINDVKWAGFVLIGALVCWVLKWLGGGDVKLIFAAALLVGSRALPDFLVLTALMGGALAGLAFGDMWLEKSLGWSTGLAFPPAAAATMAPAGAGPRKATVPYGIAICLASVATLFATSPLIRL